MRLSVILALIVLATVSGSATASYRPPVESQPLSNGALLRVNRRTVLTLRRPSGSAPATVRAAVLAQRLSEAVEAGLLPGAVQVRRVDGQLGVFAGATPLISPTHADARSAGTTVRGLAYQWAEKLRQTLSLPPLTLSARSLLIPAGESRAVRVGGVAAGPLELAPRDPDVATAAAVGDGRSIRVRAGRPGETVVAVEADGAIVGIRVVVKKYAGEALGPVTMDCTGRP